MLDRYVIVMVGHDYEVTNNIEYLLFHLWTVFGAKDEIGDISTNSIAGGSKFVEIFRKSNKNYFVHLLYSAWYDYRWM